MNIASTLRQAAADAAGAQQYPASTLYVVATPIGNLADLTLRAVHVLGLVDAIACEDTRTSATLLRHLGLHKPLLALHEHNEATAAAAVVERLHRGERVACISDAGTPAVSDPGARLVAAVHTAGLRVMPLPGASSVTTALSAAGDTAAVGYRFVGFLPAKGRERQQALEAALVPAAGAGQPSLVFFEAPHRIEALAASLAASAPGRAVTVARELTKQFEAVDTMAAGALPGWFSADADRRRGEFVIVLHAPQGVAPAHDGGLPSGALEALKLLQRELPLKQAVALAAELSGAPRNALYAQALAWRDAPAGDDDASVADDHQRP